jgi:hypothetical protein
MKMAFSVNPIITEKVIEKALTKRNTVISTTTASSTSRKLFKNSFTFE